MKDWEKVKTYLGFAIKSRNIVFGLDNLLSFSKELNLIIIGNNLTDKNENKINEFAKRKNCTLVKINKNFGDLINRPTCKLAGLTDLNLAKAIINLSEGIIFKGEL